MDISVGLHSYQAHYIATMLMLVAVELILVAIFIGTGAVCWGQHLYMVSIVIGSMNFISGGLAIFIGVLLLWGVGKWREMINSA